jgi:3-dehydroquinate dehydratase-1
MLKRIKICTVLAESDFLSTKFFISKFTKDSDFFELRADYLDNLDEKLIVELRKILTLKTIFTLKSKKNGGKSNFGELKNLSLLKAAIDIGYDFIDLEINSPLIKKLDKKSSKYILSYHNFEQTPSYYELKKIITSARRKGADLIKIATLVKNEEDLKTLAKLLLSNQKEQKLIVIGMGEFGKISRVFLPLLGSFLTYVASNNKIAAGQLTLKELKSYVF